MVKNNRVGKLIAIGECLIDEMHFPGRGSNVENHPGGAPANVAVANSQLGGQSVLLTKLGQDPQGELLVQTLKEKNVDTTYVMITDAHATTRAIVHIDKKGERSFKFDRRNSADLFFQPSELPVQIFQEGDILHFGSVDLVPSLIREATALAIRTAQQKNMLVSFDPNLRFPLWPSEDRLRETVKEFLVGVDILKMSDDELSFIYPNAKTDEAIEDLFKNQKVRLLILSHGSEGATLYLPKQKPVLIKGIKVKAVDTTGAGDALIGAFLNQLLLNGVKKDKLTASPTDLKNYLTFANKVAAYVVTKPGAISAMPALKDLKK